jgi:hypothetical protein
MESSASIFLKRRKPEVGLIKKDRSAVLFAIEVVLLGKLGSLGSGRYVTRSGIGATFVEVFFHLL